MEEHHIRLGPRDQRRARLLDEHPDGRLTVAQVSTLLGVPERQVSRLLAGYRRDGPAALVHGNRGRRPWHALPEGLGHRVVELVRESYPDADHSHPAGLLGEREDSHLDRTTIRRILLAAGLRTPRPRRAPAHRSRRERMARGGDAAPMAVGTAGSDRSNPGPRSWEPSTTPPARCLRRCPGSRRMPRALSSWSGASPSRRVCRMPTTSIATASSSAARASP